MVVVVVVVVVVRPTVVDSCFVFLPRSRHGRLFFSSAVPTTNKQHRSGEQPARDSGLHRPQDAGNRARACGAKASPGGPEDPERWGAVRVDGGTGWGETAAADPGRGFGCFNSERKAQK